MTTVAHRLFQPNPAVIIASPNPTTRKSIIQTLMQSHIAVEEATGGADALGKLESSECQLLLLDRKLPDLDTEELLRLVQSRFPGVDVLLLDEMGSPSVPHTWRSTDAHALFSTISRWNSPASATVARTPAPAMEPLPGMIGQSEQMRRVYRMARAVAPRSTPVLITGPTGTGKEVVAHAIHELSPRAGKSFVVINCAAIPETLLEAELFGYLRGAFTGAVQSNVGRIHAAHGGTLFLDEIGELPLGMQAKLLRFLDHGEVQRLGSSDVFRVDVRVVAATNVDLAQSCREGRFREDLFYRLSVFPIELPPLASRSEDIELLARHFVRQFEYEGAPATLSQQAVSALRQHNWPGNVRELQHVIERASILADGRCIDADDLSLSILPHTLQPAAELRPGA